LNIQISQGSVAADMWRCGSVCFCLVHGLSLSAKWNHICKSYGKIRSGFVFLGHGVF